MLKFPEGIAVRCAAAATVLAGLFMAQALAEPSKPSKGFGLGRAATVEEVQAWDIDVRPDGQGLPKGKGNAAKGEAIFAAKCAICHGDFAEGVDRWPVVSTRSSRTIRSRQWARTGPTCRQPMTISTGPCLTVTRRH